MGKHNYELFDSFLIRFPAYPLEKLIQNDDLEGDFLLELFSNDSYFRNAICLASYTLYSQLLEYFAKENINQDSKLKLKLALYKYYSRMCTRSTPFGFFAGISVGRFSNEIRPTFDSNKYNYHIQFDNYYLYDFKTKFVFNNEDVFLYSNNTITRFAGKYAYIEESINKKGGKSFSLSQTEYDNILGKIHLLTKNGMRQKVLINKLLSFYDEYDYSEIEEYIISLIGNGFLLTDLEISPKDNYFQKLKYTLEKTTNNIELKEKLLDLDTIINNESKTIEEKSKLLLEQAPFNGNPLKCTLKLEDSKITLDLETKKKLKKALSLFNKITPKRKTNLDLFTDIFFSKYEYQEIPLLEALSKDLGIGFPIDEKYSIKNTFVDDFKIFINNNYHNKSTNLELDGVSTVLNNKILEAYRTKETKISVDEHDFPQKVEVWNDIPNTMYGLAKFFHEQGNLKMVINGFGGSSAVNLLSRFYNTGNEIRNFVDEIIEKEKDILLKNNAESQNYIIAEIVFNPDQHVSNVLEHPLFFEYFIPILNNPKSKDNSTAILLDDLYLSISRNQKLILRSKKLNKQVKPILTNAHNFSNSQLPVYKFLSELQNYDKRMFLGFFLEPQKKIFSHIPRIEFDGIVVFEARWFINSNKFKIAKEKINEEEVMMIMKEFQTSLELPKFLLFVEGDNEFLIDFDSYISIKAFLSLIKKSSLIEFKEFLQIDSLLKDELGRNFSHEFLIAFHKNEK